MKKLVKKKKKKKKQFFKKPEGEGDTGALFDSINNLGELKLRHVKKEEKNKYRQNVEGETKTPEVKETKTKTKKKRITGSPKTELLESKWYIQNHDGNKQIIIEIETIKQAVYICKCDECNIEIKGKFNSVTLDDCYKTNLLFDTAVASCDLINNNTVKVQVTGSVPTILVDKSDGVGIFLSKTSLETSIITSKSSEMNVSIPFGFDDYKEIPIPEQFVTKWDSKQGKLITETSSHV